MRRPAAKRKQPTRPPKQNSHGKSHEKITVHIKSLETQVGNPGQDLPRSPAPEPMAAKNKPVFAHIEQPAKTIVIIPKKKVELVAPEVMPNVATPVQETVSPIIEKDPTSKALSKTIPVPKALQQRLLRFQENYTEVARRFMSFVYAVHA